jgi:hypothetical protein
MHNPVLYQTKGAQSTRRYPTPEVWFIAAASCSSLEQRPYPNQRTATAEAQPSRLHGRFRSLSRCHAEIPENGGGHPFRKSP